ncbi:nucleoside hydrolase [Frigidibacter sp. MR17.24]|uniref:nucleoside hydrolase n=1 Tax=Frigidibacter sp. MR17.24 TaxID=3127345 RepID=UPI003012A0F6
MVLPLLLDCDPGNDDAVGILAAMGDPALRLLAVTTCFGHLSGARTAQNAAIAVAVGGGGVPVHRGADEPLKRERMVARFLDLETALDAERPDLPSVALSPATSVEALSAALAAEPGATIVTTGPLTNIALLLERDRDARDRIGALISLSGAWGLGTKTPAAEWNVLSDPDAAAAVFSAGLDLTLIPVDAAVHVPIEAATIAALAALPGPVGGFAAELLRSLQAVHRAPPVGPAAAPLNDPCAVLVAAQPDLAETRPAQVTVDRRDGLTYGRTVFDFAGDHPNARVVTRIDAAGLNRRLTEVVARLASRETA